MRIVIDTNVVVSAVFFGGKPREILERVIEGSLEAYATKEILDEYRDTIDYLLEKYSGKTTLDLSMIIKLFHTIKRKTHIELCRDPDDDKFIECAVDGKCYYIISGDKDLLEISRYKNIQVVTVTEFLSLFST